MVVELMTKEKCPACNMTKKVLKQFGIQYSEVDITDNEALRAELKAEGFGAAPIVKAGSDAWDGFRPEKIKELAKQFAQKASDPALAAV